MAVRMKKCCCGCSLRTGVLFILWIYLISDILIILNCLCTMEDNMQKQRTDSNFPFPTFSLCFLEAIMIIAAFYGINERKPSFLMPFIVFSALYIVALVLWVLLFIPSPSYAFSVGIFDRSTTNYDHTTNKEAETTVSSDDDKMKITLTTFIMCVHAVLKIYFTLVVFSYKKCMVEEQKGNANVGIIANAPAAESPPASYPQQQTAYPAFYEQQPPYSAPYTQPQPMYAAPYRQEPQYPPPYETTETSYPYIPHVKQ